MKSILEVVRDLIKPYIDKNANNIAPVEVSPVENPYYVGDQLIYNGVLYTVTNDVAIDDDLEVGVNITPSQNVLNQLSTAESDMVGATSSANGTHGLVPQPLAGEQNKYLRGDGSWASSDATPTANSINNVQSGGVKTELDKKLSTYAGDATAWDTAPTSASTKPVTSGGVYTGLAGKVNTSDIVNNVTTTTAGKVLDARVAHTLDIYKTGMAVIATRQANLTASRNYNVGEQFIYAEEPNKIYKATATINKDDPITIGGNASAADNVTTQIGNLIATTSGTCSLDLRNVDTFWYGQAGYSVTKSGYTPIAWSLSLSNYAGVTNLQVESATVSSGQLQLTMYGSPFVDQAKVNHTVTVRVVWLKNK